MQIHELQKQIRQTDHQPDMADGYMLKLIEEIGELAEALRKGYPTYHEGLDSIKGTLDEELYDVLYYVLVLANLHHIDMEQAIKLKLAYNEGRKR